VVLVELARKNVEERLHGLRETARQVFAQAADADVTRKHPEPGEHLVQVQQLLAFAEAVQHHRDGAHVHRVRAEPHQVARDALQLRDHHADPGDSVWHLEADQFLDREAVREAVGLRPQIVHALDERHDLLPLLLFRGFFDARVQEPDRRLGRHDVLAIEFQHQPQHAVRAGMLRSHVDGHRLGAQLRHGDSRSNRT